MGKLAQSCFGLGILLIAYGVNFSAAYAQESPKQIGYYCGSDTASITEGQYYIPGGSCTYLTHSLSGYRYGDIFRGTVGSSTIITGHGLEFNGTSSPQYGDIVPNPVQGEDLFVAAYEVPGGMSSYVFAMRRYLTGAASDPPAGINYGIIRFKYGVEPIKEGCRTDCNSSVLFLPGIMGSRLLDDGVRRWEPIDDSDVVALYLDEEGKSLNPDITATDVLDTFDGPLMFNIDIYSSFLEDLDSMKADGKISDYAAVPYDWRLSLPDILADHSIEQRLRDLAVASRTDKVTIVAHSNGGLVAKALLNQLGPDASSLVDQLILVGVPQIGTPQAIGVLLHGADSGIPFRYSAARAREYAKNSPMIYHLLPQGDYYHAVGTAITTPVVTFEEGVSAEFMQTYGQIIGNQQELRAFITGAEGRTQPQYDQLEYPSIGSSYLLQQAEHYRSEIDASWAPPSGVIVHQIAGVGEDTLAGLTYSRDIHCVEKHVSQTSTPSCLRYEESVKYTPNTVKDGDGTVVVPSALAMSTSTEQVKRWWLNLNDYNSIEKPHSNIPGFGFLRTDHKNLLEINSLRMLIVDNFLIGSSTTRPKYVSDTMPIVGSGETLRFILHSPLALSVMDAEGNEVSENRREVPGATFKRYGEVQVVTVPRESAPMLHLSGVADGSFTLDIEQYTGKRVVAVASYVGIPSSTSTTVAMNFPDGSIENAGDLLIDYNGDGSTDVTLTPRLNGEVLFPKVPLTVTARDVVVQLGAAIPEPAADISGFPGNVTLETSGITGVPSCTTNATSSSVGSYPIVCTKGSLVSDVYSFETYIPGSVKVVYGWNGFLRPVSDPVMESNPSPNIFKSGSTVPVKFQLTSVDGVPVSAKTPPQWLEPVREAKINNIVDEIEFSGLATDGSVYRWDSESQQYIYNWKTKGYAAGYWYTVYVWLDDGTLKSAVVGLK